MKTDETCVQTNRCETSQKILAIYRVNKLLTYGIRNAAYAEYISDSQGKVRSTQQNHSPHCQYVQQGNQYGGAAHVFGALDKVMMFKRDTIDGGFHG